MLNELDVTDARPVAANVSVCDCEAKPLNVRSVKVATPLLVTRGRVPPSVPEVEVTPTEAVALVTVLPPLSTTLTTGCVASCAPEAPPTGCVDIARLVAAPTVTVMF